jgi:hypothetical protein
MNKVAYEIWEIIKGERSYKLSVPMGCDAGELLSALYEFRTGVIEEIKRIEAKIKPAETTETPVEVVDQVN